MTTAGAVAALVTEIDVTLRANARLGVDTAFLQHYLGRERPALGLANDTTRAIAKAALRGNPMMSTEEWLATLDALYAGETYEHRLLAGMVLGESKRVRQMVGMDRLRTWIGELRGWAEIDGTCASTWTGAEMAARWDAWQPFLESCAHDANVSRRRASLVLLCKPVRSSGDLPLRTQAFANIQTLKSERTGLITKAVSWLLRDLIRQNPAEVAAFVEANAATLPAIAVRETRNKLATGRKSGKL